MFSVRVHGRGGQGVVTAAERRVLPDRRPPDPIEMEQETT
jgi:hypothetical protein